MAFVFLQRDQCCFSFGTSQPFASTHRRYPDALADVLPFFAGIVLFTHRELIAHLFNMEPDWPWQSQRRSHRRAIDHLQGMILAGELNNCLTFARQAWGVPVAGLPTAEEGVAQPRTTSTKPVSTDRSCCRGQSRRHGRGWAGDAAEEPGRSGERHPPARPYDRTDNPTVVTASQAPPLSQRHTGDMRRLLLLLPSSSAQPARVENMAGWHLLRCARSRI